MEKQSIYKRIIVVFFDILYLSLTGFAALLVRFEFRIGSIPTHYLNEYLRCIPIFVITHILIYVIFRLYRSVWRFASVNELLHVVYAYLTLIPVIVAEIFLFHINLPRSIYVIMYLLNGLFCILVRFSDRIVRYISANMDMKRDGTERVMVIGAGDAARTLIADIAISKRVHYQVVCIIDDDRSYQGRFMGSIPIVGTRDDIPAMVEKYEVDRIIFAIPSLSGKERTDILNICQDTGCKVQVIPGIYQLVNGEVSVSKLRDVDVVDLLGRDEIHVNNEEIFNELSGKVVLVTGGGGSIGSELCRQIAAAEPKQLIIFDIYENNAYDIQNELKAHFPYLDVVTLIGSVRNTARVEKLFEKYRPEVVYHAAAHKHVPLMEDSPCEAIKNNCMGTFKLGTAAAKYGTRRFLLISTDKAVNPTNVMGASKRICEMVVQMLDRKYEGTTYCAVRFGNVLGSNGSVIPLFREQIAAGGPVTVTDKNIIRYFMTIPEAVTLVLQASMYAKGGEIFVLDMGSPVRIDDMARRMIELSGLVPDEDIEIQYTGLRPGEKLYEELLIDKNRMAKTANDLIFIEEPYPMDDDAFLANLKELDHEAKEEDPKIRELIKKIVPEYSGI